MRRRVTSNGRLYAATRSRYPAGVPGRVELSSQCLDRRIPDKQTLIDEIDAWEHDRNANHTKANWQFTTSTARIKLKHLYPSI